MGSIQEREKRRESFVDGDRGIDAREAAFPFVELDEGGGLLMVDFQAVLRGLKGVVGALDQLAAAAVADAFLRDRAREAIEDESVGAFRRGEAGGDHVGDDLVGDELAGLHAGFRLFAEFSAGGHFAAEDFAGGDVRELFLRHQGIGERAFAGAGRAEQNEILFRNHKSETSESDDF